MELSRYIQEAVSHGRKHLGILRSCMSLDEFTGMLDRLGFDGIPAPSIEESQGARAVYMLNMGKKKGKRLYFVDPDKPDGYEPFVWAVLPDIDTAYEVKFYKFRKIINLRRCAYISSRNILSTTYKTDTESEIDAELSELVDRLSRI